MCPRRPTSSDLLTQHSNAGWAREVVISARPWCLKRPLPDMAPVALLVSHDAGIELDHAALHKPRLLETFGAVEPQVIGYQEALRISYVHKQ